MLGCERNAVVDKIKFLMLGNSRAGRGKQKHANNLE